MNSIRSRLLIWQISALLIAALLAGALTYLFARRGFEEVRDFGLLQIAHSVLRHDETPIPQAAPDPTVDLTSINEEGSANNVALADEGDATEPDEGQFVSQIWSPSGTLVFSSLEDNGPTLQLPGFHTVEWQGQNWRTYTLLTKGRTAQVAVSVKDRDSAFYEFLPWVLVPMIALVLFLAMIIHQAVKRALRPLDKLRQQIDQRAVSDLHALDANNLPTEVAPLALALNQLLAQLDQLLVQQRQFLADAAHELNTPLAAVKLQAQLVRRAPIEDRDASLNELDRGIERTIHLASQLLQLARLEPDARPPERSAVAWHELVRQAVIQLAPLAEEREIDLGLLSCEPVQVQADAHALQALLNNLIDNALRYAPRGAQVDVALAAQAGWAELMVSDNGPGIEPAQRERALQRFVRLSGSEATGSGLGLAIVHSIVQAHGGEIQLAVTPGGGLTVCVRLPCSQQPP